MFWSSSSFLQKTIRAYWSKRRVETNGYFQNHCTHLEIIITWCYRKPFLFCVWLSFECNFDMCSLWMFRNRSRMSCVGVCFVIPPCCNKAAIQKNAPTSALLEWRLMILGLPSHRYICVSTVYSAWVMWHKSRHFTRFKSTTFAIVEQCHAS